MDDIEDDDTRYPSNPYRVSHHHQGYDYMSRQKLLMNVSPYSKPVKNGYGEDNSNNEGEGKDEEEEPEKRLGEEDDVDQSGNIQTFEKDADDNEDEEEDDVDANGDGDENCDDNDDDDDDDDNQKSYFMEIDDDLECQPKRQKLKSLISAYEFAPHVPSPSAVAPSALKPSFGGRNPLTDWSEHETFVLLAVWGDRFLQHGRKSLRSEEWQEVAEKVSKVSSVERTDTQCRNRLDTLKKKYKKEKIKFPETDGGSSNWVYFKRMDKLMSSPPQVDPSCGLDSGEYVSTNSRIYSNRANGLDEMRDSLGNTESTEEASDGPHAKKRRRGRGSGEASSYRLLADSLHRFSNIYEKIENDRRQQMVELEKMRVDIQKEIETQRREILERLQSEISKLEQTDEENDGSSENGM
ncbi:PREDICTED: trihelix transcription factor ASIL2-like isoform X2 [Lupinus angustifolius]|uniref:trihelix transcription factor ASIL2-like isoform X2 n=1 Tax=Lupinus angustifolius TaxID=3871 RepID=UPI00092E98E7|nr:PREDICTED: trihelix transcription factor ASIL2-like isoform X2 [Lupinus angustifolius]XP_019457582.1 PREDICTED: trihelix transcription factor ASIL2-like isoform X2 [Lupinus angustifolius]